MSLNDQTNARLKVDISMVSIFKVIGVLLLIWFIYAVKEVFAV